ncbi:hypothetical protein [Bradyrhizobium sp. UFLA05-112]
MLAVWRKMNLDPDISADNPAFENGTAHEIGEDRIRDIWAKARILVNDLAACLISESSDQLRSDAAAVFRRAVTPHCCDVLRPQKRESR